MQDLIRRLRKLIAATSLVLAAATFASCAAQKQTALVEDPDSKHESMIPWNRQEKWETGGQMGALTDKR